MGQQTFGTSIRKFMALLSAALDYFHGPRDFKKMQKTRQNGSLKGDTMSTYGNNGI
jgi:hypothetical protein